MSEKRKNGNNTIAGLVGIFLIILPIYVVWDWAFGDDDFYEPKSKIQSDVSSMIKNGASLDSLKHYFTSAFNQQWGLIYRWDKEKKDHYRQDVSLLIVLKDIESENYLNGRSESDNLDAISKLIAEYQERNPFDGLEVNQKDLFENIRVKLGDKYNVVSNDVNKLSDELSQKNKLLTRYLSDSQTSLYISIVSLAFGLVLPILSMLYKKRRSLRVLK